jgi:alkanesulfonate monooxygenase SsuD/methylene tetrahydromethanopterin reductase-like flavin-dependent oxidoreductase (luciferase family)
MKFGFTLTGLLQQPANVDMQKQFRDVVELVQLARELGFDYLYSGQHYLSAPYQMMQPLPTLARLAADAEGMGLVITTVLPLHHPVNLAEVVSSLDIITGGNMALVAALGYRDEEYNAFGVAPGTRVPKMLEAMEVMKLLWSGEEVTYHGEYFQLDHATIGIPPVRKPHPSFWVAGNGDVAIERAARLGYDWYINPHAAYETIARQVTLYNETRQAAGHPAPTIRPMAREVFVGETREQAFQICGPYLGAKYATYAQWGQDKAMPDDGSLTAAFAELAGGRFIIGDAEDVITDLTRYQDMGVTHASLRMGWPGMPKEAVATCMRLVAERVMPSFKEPVTGGPIFG